MGKFLKIVLLQKKVWQLKYFKTFFLFFLVCFFCCGAGLEQFVIKPEVAAMQYNNKGINYLKDGHYLSAISAFKIALALNSESSSAAPIYNNLGQAYLKTGEPQMAQECFEAALHFAPMGFKYYQNLILAYKTQNLLKSAVNNNSFKIEKGMEPIIYGLAFIELGDYQQGKKFLQNFAKKEPNLIITNSINDYLKQITDDL